MRPQSISSHTGWLGVLILSSLVVYLAGWVSPVFFVQNDSCAIDAVNCGAPWFGNWDGVWYNRILLNGYLEADGGHPTGFPVFFPLYPLLGRMLYSMTHLPSTTCLLAVTWAALIGLAYRWQRYCHLRFPAHSKSGDAAFLLLFFWPASLFLRVNYTEALFLFLTVTLFYGFTQRWPIRRLIVLTGLIVATRPTGVVCLAVLGYHTWLRFETLPPSRRRAYSLLAMIAGAWGLFAYMLYLHVALGDAWLFFTEHRKWSPPTEPGIDGIVKVLSFKPLWEFFVSGAPGNPTLWLWALLNNLSWLLAAVLTAIGIRKGWLTREEALYSILLLAMIYLGTATSRDLMAAGRSVLTVFPIYIVMARLLQNRSQPVISSLIGLCAALLFLLSALFAAWYKIN